MATLTEQMESLAADILSGHEERRAWLSALREDVAELRQQSRAWVEENRAWLSEFLEQCRSDLEGARRAWQEMVEARQGERGRKPTPRGGPEARPTRRPRRARSK